jgi:hypothetical protein
MTWVESAASSYADAVASAIPLHRAVLVIVSAFSFLVYRTTSQGSVLSKIYSIPISDLWSISSPILKRAVVGDLIFGACFVAASVVLARFALWCLFSLALRSTSLISRINSVVLSSRSLGIEERKRAAEFAESSLGRPAKRIRTVNRLAEFIWVLGLLLVMLGVLRSVVDTAIGSLLLVLAAIIFVRVTNIFLSEYFGIAMYVAKLEGRTTPKLGDLDE